MQKKTKILFLSSLVLLLISVVGAAYAYFTVNTESNFETPMIDASTPSIETVSLKSTDNNLYLNLTRSNMMSTNTGEYYAVTDENGVASSSENKIEIGQTQVIGDGTYTCNYTLKVENTGDMKDNLTKEGVLILTVNDIDYDVYSTEFPLTINGTFENISSSVVGKITASLKFVNTNEKQDELVNKSIKLEINSDEFNCTANENDNKNVQTLVTYLINNVSSEELWDSTLEDDGYRYVGTDPDNYICFGTTDKDTCIDDTDKYMYRIIGMFEDKSGNKHAKLIKKEALNTTYAWNINSTTAGDWNNSNLYKRLNGSYFLTNTSYPYMQDSSWTDKITTWKYTMTNTKSYENYNTNSVYGIIYCYSAVKVMYLHELNRSSKSSETCYYSSSETADCNAGEWKTLSTKISLMYASDYALSLGSVALSYISNSKYTTMKTGWMHISNNDSGTPSSYEWTMSRGGGYGDGHYGAWRVASNGSVNGGLVSYAYAVRPVFYLESDAEILGGTGTSSDPFILSVN